MNEPALHVYANSVTEWFVAESVDTAIDAARTHLRDVCGVTADEMDLDFTQEPDTKILRIWDDAHETQSVKTCVEWAKENGPGFLCSTEF